MGRKNILLSSVIREWPEEVWLDAGIMYPFFRNDCFTDPHCWLDELIALARRNQVFTTQMVVNEVKNTWRTWRHKDKAPISKRYYQFFQMIDVKHHSGEERPPLSAPDDSLTRRRSGTLFTSDRDLYRLDRGPTALVKLGVHEVYTDQTLSVVYKK